MLIKKGAEANLYLEEWHNRKVIMKRRLPKRYRIQELDKEIRSQRTVHEPHIIHKAKEAGVPTPTIFMVDVAEANIIMEFVEGKQVKQVLNDLPPEERLRLSRHIGGLIGCLHKHGIIHGDLTTSNMILTPYDKVVFVDFGLSERSTELETKGVDLHLMKRAFQSTHYKYARECFEAVMEGYAEVVGEEEAKNVLEKIREIERRGRYVSER
ncbi:MAG: Kae1-associated kinase Bud32 [Candidatus Bathyarchaeota archaeon]|nr:Kae1-associated kinase Bud32 [Candidatus Bathyarchaeota archaeon]